MDSVILNYVNNLTTQKGLLTAARNNLLAEDPVVFKAYDCDGNELYLPAVTLITGEADGIETITQDYKDALIAQLAIDIADIDEKIAATPCEVEPMP